MPDDTPLLSDDDEVEAPVEGEETKVADVKEEEAPAAPSDAETISYETVTLPETTLLNEDDLKSVREFAEEQGLTLDTAKAMILRDHEVLAARDAAESAFWQTQKNDWREEIKHDTELGGNNLKRTKTRVNAVLSRFAPEGMHKRLKETGYIDEPNLARLLNKVAAAMEESSEVPSGPTKVDAAPLSAREEYAQEYPNSPFPR